MSGLNLCDYLGDRQVIDIYSRKRAPALEPAGTEALAFYLYWVVSAPAVSYRFGLREPSRLGELDEAELGVLVRIDDCCGV
jgi:hypothetical protein